MKIDSTVEIVFNILYQFLLWMLAGVLIAINAGFIVL